MCGWIKVHRSALDHWCASDPNFMAVWFRLLCEANYASKKTLLNGAVVTVERGQLVYGREAFSARCGVPVGKLRRIISTLESEGMISQQKTNKYSLISITNYEKYQCADQPTASIEPSASHQPATPKEVKEFKNNNTPDGSIPECPHQDIIDLYHEHCPTMRRVRAWPEARQKLLRARWRENPKHQNLDFWVRFFTYVSQSDFLRGDASNFAADLEWLVRSTNFLKIIEGKYHNSETA